MLNYINTNVNPKGRKTGDCSTRALVGVLGIPYETAISKQAEVAIKRCYGLTDKETIDWVLKEYGYVKIKQPRKTNGKKYLVRELDEILTSKQLEEGVLVSVAHHLTCIKDYAIQDTWNCGGKSVGNYWIKAGEEYANQYFNDIDKQIKEIAKEVQNDRSRKKSN